MVEIDVCALCGEERQCVRVEHIGPVCQEDIAEVFEAREHEEGQG